MTDWLRQTAGGVSVAVTAVPRASRTQVAGIADGRLRIRVAAPPVDGAANDELVRFLAKALDLPKAAVVVTAGTAGRRKTIALRGISPEAVRRLVRE